MKHITLLALLLVVSCGQNSSQESSSSNNGLKTSTKTQDEQVIKAAIIGGKDVEEIDPIYHSTIALTTKSGYFLCSGTLISENLVLTAAHCVTYWRDRFLLGPKQTLLPGVCIAFGNYRKEPKNIVCETEVSYYPAKTSLESFTNQDIAVIKINNKVPDGFKPVSILDGSYKLETDTELVTAGYGDQLPTSTPYAEDRISGYLKKADVVFSHASGAYLYTKQLNGVYGATHGDSGGPVYLETHDELLVVASISGGIDGQKLAFNTYTTLFKQFILESVKKLNATKPIFKNPISE